MLKIHPQKITAATGRAKELGIILPADDVNAPQANFFTIVEGRISDKLTIFDRRYILAGESKPFPYDLRAQSEEKETTEDGC